jgi:hypothetical protein
VHDLSKKGFTLYKPVSLNTRMECTQHFTFRNRSCYFMVYKIRAFVCFTTYYRQRIHVKKIIPATFNNRSFTVAEYVHTTLSSSLPRKYIFCFAFGRSRVQIFGPRPAALTKGFLCFPLSLQSDT